MPKKSAAPRKSPTYKSTLSVTRKRTTPERTQAAPLAREEIARSKEPIEGFEQYVEPLLSLYEKKNGALQIRSLDVSKVRGRLSSYQALAPLETSARQHLKMVSEARTEQAAELWDAMLEIYDKAEAVGRTSPEIRRSIAEFGKFVAGKAQKKSTPTTRS